MLCLPLLQLLTELFPFTMFILFFFLKLLDVIILFLMDSFLFMAKRFDFIMGFLFFLMEFITLPRSSAFALLGASGSHLDLLVLEALHAGAALPT